MSAHGRRSGFDDGARRTARAAYPMNAGRRHRFGWALLPFLVLAGAAAPPAAPVTLHPERVSKMMLGATTRGGQLVATKDAAGWRITLGPRTVLDGAPLGAVRVRLVTVAATRDADLVVALLNTDTGCPVRFAVIAVRATGHADASPPFGTCSDLDEVVVQGGALVFTMPDRADGAEAPRRVRFTYEAGVVSGPLPP